MSADGSDELGEVAADLDVGAAFGRGDDLVLGSRPRRRARQQRRRRDEDREDRSQQGCIIFLPAPLRACTNPARRWPAYRAATLPWANDARLRGRRGGDGFHARRRHGAPLGGGPALRNRWIRSLCDRQFEALADFFVSVVSTTGVAVAVGADARRRARARGGNDDQRHGGRSGTSTGRGAGAAGGCACCAVA